MDVSRSRGLTRFVGRDADMQILESALASAKQGKGRAVGIVANGPFLSVYLRTDAEIDNAQQRSQQQWRTVQAEVVAQGAPEELVAQIDPLSSTMPTSTANASRPSSPPTAGAMSSTSPTRPRRTSGGGVRRPPSARRSSGINKPWGL